MNSTSTAAAAMQTELLTFALRLPEAYEDRPWGETVVKVRNKIFVFLGGPPDAVSFTLKLPRSHGYALSLPYAKPAGYGLGKSNWVSYQTTIVTAIEVPLVKEWIVESYRAVAPKKLAVLVKLGSDNHGEETNDAATHLAAG